MIGQLIGIPFVSKGRDPAIGLDCWGLVRVFYERVLHITLPSYADQYEAASDSVSVATAVSKNLMGGWLPVLEPQFGDGVLLRIDDCESHVGVYLGDGKMLHTQAGHNSVIDRVDGLRWKNRVIGFYRHLSVLNQTGEGAV